MLNQAFSQFAPRHLKDSAVVLLSGGLDSATVLALVKSLGYTPYALSFRYGQRHSSELDAASRLAQQLGAARHEIIDLDLRRFGGSALTDIALELPTSQTNTPHQDIPITYVPARNTIMLSCALGWMEALGACDIFFGANAVDYSGYPDCRPEYIAQFQNMANLATKSAVEGKNIQLHTPLIDLSKEAIIAKGLHLGVDYSVTVSCYQADKDGLACGVCDSCRLRQNGFKAAGVVDPTHYQ